MSLLILTTRSTSRLIYATTLKQNRRSHCVPLSVCPLSTQSISIQYRLENSLLANSLTLLHPCKGKFSFDMLEEKGLFNIA